MEDDREGGAGDEKVRRFYDQFRDERMVGYRLDGSRRIDEAVRAATRFLRPGMTIADVGCGIGIFSEALAAREPTSRVIGIDISPANIAYAKKTVAPKNVAFSAVDVTDQFNELRKLASGPIDLLCMVDVIEHIPSDGRAALMRELAEVASKKAVLFLAYPSPEYQRHLMENDPEELQVIDNIVELADLLAEASAAGWILKEFKYVDIWRKNQYIHAVFSRDLNVEEVPFDKPGLVQKARNLIDARILRPRRMAKYGVTGRSE